ncbi:hypothetical protein CEXT_358441 [Caerostris extrusa]|uniref:Transposase n=1 Tax=Caerostris extrusa TaxID=172846 RepID=A0AAV4U0C2_CAEEX|nr:hypothetical protein CEXT_358441 [Caerostris extrusa]
MWREKQRLLFLAYQYMEYVVKYLSPDICVETDSAWGNYKNLARERLPELSPFNKRMIMSELKQHSAPILAHQTVLLFSVRKINESHVFLHQVPI